MGVPALFRWLSKKYPKIIYPVEEEEEIKVPDEEGNNIVIPVNMSQPNPNGTEFDNLYLDMNGIVHPCTHPEGKPAPETEEEMMLEIFSYTERVVNMIRPRKLLFIAIDGVAPRAKMNQQRSRRFRSAQEAKDKEDARKESVALWESMGKEISEDEKNKVSWDSNAITPGTPFMDLLASSLRYWIVKKMNSDSGWKQMQVIISDAGVPGEGEHKIMDFIRRQRSNPGHDPNTRHVIYGLDADLIMLALATHEPHFRVLREDVFANDGSSTACRMCGQEGHYAAQCTGTKAEIQKKPPAEKKPFIFLDVAILREYLEVELNVTQAPFPFNLEQALDDWVLLIFFVGNDFLPHLPSLEIREGAIDTLLKIWKQELPRMGGYLTNHGEIEMTRAQIILEGLAKREDEIFRRRREAEERQDQNAKRRKIEMENNKKGFTMGPSATLSLTAPPTAPSTSSSGPSVHPSLPQRPASSFNFAANADSIGFGAPPTAQSVQNVPTAAQALAGSNRDVVANRRAIRMANMSAAEMLKAELSGLSPVKPNLALPPKPTPEMPPPSSDNSVLKEEHNAENDVPGFGNHAAFETSSTSMIDAQARAQMSEEPAGTIDTAQNASTAMNVDGTSQLMKADETMVVESDADADGEVDPDHSADSSIVGVKRKFGDAEGPTDETPDAEEILGSDDDDAPPDVPLALKVNADGTVEQEDTVKLWEPGYKERYYRQKFGIELNDTEFRKNLTKSYIEGLAWVLHYYYQGTPSWQWYYPYHFAPFAADFEEVDKMDITFQLGQPFKPFEQLMGVFPAASRQHIPSVFHHLMTEEESPIIDFYPPTFEIDMNGKKMAWQGVALLPFINPDRLLEAMSVDYDKLTEEEERRNRWGNTVVFAADEHPLYPFFERLYGKRKSQDPVPIDTRLSKGISGTVLPNPDCIPGSTYYSPLPEQGLPDIKNDRSLSVLYYFPKQLTPHRSTMLPGVKKSPRVLTSADLEVTRNGGRGRGRGGFDRGGGGRGSWNNGSSDRGRGDPYHSRPTNYGQNSYGNDRGSYGNGGSYGNDRGSYGNDRGSYGNDRGSYGNGGDRGYGRGGNNSYQPPSRTPYQQYGYGGGRPPQQYGGQGQYSAPNRGGAPARGGAPNYGGYNANGGGYGGYGSPGGGAGYGGYGGYGGPAQAAPPPPPSGYPNGGGRGRGTFNNAPPRGGVRGW